MARAVRQPGTPQWSLSVLLADLRQDLHYGWRQLRRAPAFSTLVVATLAIGIGANATMAGVIDRLVLRAPAGMHEPDALTRILTSFRTPDGVLRTGAGSDYRTFLDLKAGVPALSAIAGYMAATPLPLVSDDPAAEARVSYVTAGFFQTLGAVPALGSFFSEKDGFPATAQTGGPPLAVVSHSFWQREQGGNRSAIGRSLRVGKLSYTIVGVAAPLFRGIASEAPDVWVPITVALEVEQPMRVMAMRDGAYMQLVGRIKDGASRGAVEAQGTVIVRTANAFQLSKAGRSSLPTVIAASVVAARGPDAPREIKVTLWLGGVSSLVLLIVCANVANLLMGRAFARRREIAVRLALGAGRARLARQLLTEALLLSTLGGLFGLVIASAGGTLLQKLLAVDAQGGSVVDTRLFLFTMAVAVGTGVLISLLPMMQSTAPDLSHGLRASSRGYAGGAVPVRTVLLASQGALCVTLLVCAALFAGSLRRVQRLDLGVDLDRTLQVSLVGVRDATSSTSSALAVLDEIKRSVAALPGVRGAAFAQSVFGGGRAVAIHTREQSFDELFPPGSWNEAMFESGVDSAMFRTLGAGRSLRGRDFASTDRAGERRVTILNAPLAKRVFPSGDALGQCVILPRWNDKASETECVEVIGVLNGYYRQSLLNRDGMVAFVPLAQQTMRQPAPFLYVSTDHDAKAVAASVRAAILEVRPGLRRLSVQSMRDVVEPEMRPWNLAASMFVLFGGVALVIASIGIYAVVSFSVVQRHSEIAVRLALGARTRHIGALVGQGSLYAVTAGIGAGVLAVLVVRRSIGPMLFETSPSDPFIIGGVALLLLTVAFVAMIVPLARALGVNPGEVMRSA